MTPQVTRDEFTKRWVLICMTCAVFATLMIGYYMAMDYLFDVKMSEQAINFVVACAVNTAFFVYIRWAVVPRMITRGRGARYGIAMHLPLITYVNIAILAFDLKPAAFEDIGLGALGVAGAILAAIVFFDAAWMPDKTPQADD